MPLNWNYCGCCQHNIVPHSLVILNLLLRIIFIHLSRVECDLLQLSLPARSIIDSLEANTLSNLFTLLDKFLKH